MPKLSSRVLRRIVIAGVFLAVFTLTGLGLRRATTPVPTCTDSVMNGEEEGVDCGFSACGKYCELDLDPPQVISTKLIKAGENDYDFVAEIKNPHPQFGASEIEYELTLFNGGENELGKEEGIFYILPGQTKYLVLTHITTEKNVQRIDFKIKSATWQKIESLEGMNLIVKAQKYISLSGGTALDANVLNDSDFDFEMVDIDVVMYDSRGDIIAVNRSDIRTFLARTERAFRVAWPFKIDGRADNIEVYLSTNLFINSNFIKAYGSEIHRFQQY
ncbi:MAG: hypothetical protein Q7S43_00295 [bacterium]|nr:hypothetical protein [bacterium]